jgi:nitrite reductase/ring-hydroxylating ferredoxin subunit
VPRRSAVSAPEWRVLEYCAGKVTDYADGDRKVVVCGEFEVGVFRIDGEFFAWHNRCAHRAGPVCQGRIMQRVIEPVAADRTIRAQSYDPAETHIICPWHGYEYNIKTGCHQGNRSVRLRKAETTIRDAEIYVRV